MGHGPGHGHILLLLPLNTHSAHSMLSGPAAVWGTHGSSADQQPRGMRVGGAARSVWFNFVGRDFFNALAEKDEPLFKLMLVKYLVSFVAGIPVFVWADYLQVTPRHTYTRAVQKQLPAAEQPQGKGRRAGCWCANRAHPCDAGAGLCVLLCVSTH